MKLSDTITHLKGLADHARLSHAQLRVGRKASETIPVSEAAKKRLLGEG
jgi:hypothetical protein